MGVPQLGGIEVTMGAMTDAAALTALHAIVDRYDGGDPGVTVDAYDAAIETLVDLGEL
jgi:hypothetical protein